MKKKFNVGIVGVGNIANKFHIPSFINNNKIGAISLCDKNKNNLKKSSRMYGIKSCFTNLKKMIRNKKIDILNICSPPSFHFKHMLEGIQNNINIISEKPFVISIKEFNLIKKKLFNRKTHCYCAYHQRSRPISKKIKDLIKRKKIGDIYFINIVYRKFRGIPKHSKYFSQKKYSGGGPLIDIGSHYFDLIGWFLNFPKLKNLKNYSFNKISALKKDEKYLPFKKFNNEELAMGSFQFKNGCVVNYELGYALNVRNETSFIEIFGTKGMIKWPDGEMTLIKNNKKYKKKIKCKTRLASQIQIDNFIKLLSKKFKITHLNEIKFTVNLIERLYRST